MPWRAQRVTPVLAWAPHRPQLRVQDPIEVERLVWAPLTGAGSLTDPRRRMRGILHGQPVGPVFDLPEGALVWGFTAMIVEQVQIGRASCRERVELSGGGGSSRERRQGARCDL